VSGTASTPLTGEQADAVLAAVASSLRISRTSALRALPGELVTASLVPASPLMDVSELVDGALNIAWTVKDVLYKDAKAIAVPTAGDLQGSGLIEAMDGAGEVLGGQPLPLPLGTVGGQVVPSTTDIAGLLGQVFGELTIPRLSVRLSLEWRLRYRGKQSVEGEDFIATSGLTSPTVSLLIPPFFDEMRADTIKTPHVDLACLSAVVTLKLDSGVGERQLVFETPSVPILILPLLIPTIVVVFSEPNFGVTDGSWALVIVPEHSPLAGVRHLTGVLAKIDRVVDALSSIASLATWILGLDEVTSAITDHPRIRFINRDKVSDLDDVTIRPGPFFGVFGDATADDEAQSIMMLGPVGTKAIFYNNSGFDTSDGISGRQGAYSVTMTDELPYVFIRDLAQGDAQHVGPTSIPADAVGDVITDTYDTTFSDPTWNKSMSSFQFDAGWIGMIAKTSATPVTEPLPDCRERPVVSPIGPKAPSRRSKGRL
jgi:hypothetical protein